jgi:hypothetical protein
VKGLSGYFSSIALLNIFIAKLVVAYGRIKPDRRRCSADVPIAEVLSTVWTPSPQTCGNSQRIACQAWTASAVTCQLS